MSTRVKSRTTAEPTAASPEDIISALEEGREPPHQRSLMDVADQAALTGVVDGMARRDKIPGEDRILLAADPDADALDNEYSGEEAPGGTNATPDQNDVDDIGRAYGLQEADAGALGSTEAVLNRRDRHRWELDPRSRDPEA